MRIKNLMLNRKLALFFLLAIIVFCIFLPTIKNDFVSWDDHFYIYKNPTIQSLTLTNIKAMITKTHQFFWGPLLFLSFAIDYQLFKLNSAGFHFTNTLLHTINALLIFGLFIKIMTHLFKPSENHQKYTIYIIGFFTVLLWAIHPMRVEAVAWVSARKDILCTFFTLLCFMTYLCTPKKNWIVYLTFIAALLSKPTAIMIPFILILFDFLSLQKNTLFKTTIIQSIWQKRYFILLSIIIFLAAIGQAGGSHPVQLKINQLYNWFYSFYFYIYKTIWPISISIAYPNPIYSLQTIHNILLPICFCLGITSMSLYLAIKKKHPWLLVAILFYIISLFPVSGIIRVGIQTVADRFSYLSSLGLFFYLGGICIAYKPKLPIKTIQKICVTLFACTLVIFFCIHTLTLIPIWNNSMSLYQYQIAKHPNDHHIIHTNIAIELLKNKNINTMDKNQLNDIISLLQHSKTINPRHTKNYFYLGKIYQALHQYKKAKQYYFTELRIKPRYQTYINLANMMLTKNNHYLAKLFFTKALEMNHKKPDAYKGLATISHLEKNNKNAIKLLQTALKYTPDETELIHNLNYISGK